MSTRLKTRTTRPSSKKWIKQTGVNTLVVSTALVAGIWALPAHAVPVTAPVGGEIEEITVNDINDHWSGGVIVAGGQNIIIPKNLLIDLPANRVTLQQLFIEASSSCQTKNETGLAKGDTCNASGTGGIATIMATRNDNGHVIAGDVFIQKGVESVTGQITYIDYNKGYFRVNGKVGSAAEGTMVRINDPDSRHTIQSGDGCAASSLDVNCSPDPRFTLDGDNYTNVFSTGYPSCIPSMQTRTFTDILGLGVTTTQAQVDGTGDVLCPTTNRPGPGLAVADSRRFAPLLVGDSITAEGNYENVGGVHFLSAHSTTVSVALATKLDANQPDYMFLDEVGIDAPGFQNRRARSLIIGYSTLAPDILLWSIHYDPKTNSPHEFPLATTAGCDAAAGPLTCTGQGLVANAGGNIFKIRHDVDFAVNTKPRWNPCAHLQADARFNSANPCSSGPGGTIAEQFAVLSPIPHEIQARTGRKYADLTSGIPPQLITIDINGNEATNGQYLFPFGIGLGGISIPEMVEIDLNALQTPTSFTGIPWNLDRRLSPGGCLDNNNDGIGECEATAQPLSPFPFEGAAMDPRNLSTIPSGAYSDPAFVSGSLTNVSDRILSYINPTAARPGNGIGIHNTGNFTTALLDWQAPPPSTGGPGSIEVSVKSSPVIPQALICSANTAFNSPPVVHDDIASTDSGVATTVLVLSNDSDVNFSDILTISAVSTPSNGTATIDGATIIYTPAAGFSGTDTFTYTVTDGLATVTGTVTVSVKAISNNPPIAVADTITILEDSGTMPIDVLFNDTDDSSGTGSSVLSIASVTSPAHGTVSIIGDAGIDHAQRVNYTPNANYNGPDAFSYIVADGQGGTATANVALTVSPVNDVPVALPETATVIQGTSMVINVLDNDTDIDGDVLTVSLAANPLVTPLGKVTTNGSTVSYAANAGATGNATFSYTISDGHGGTATATVTVKVIAPVLDVLGFTRAQFTVSSSEWRVDGTGSVPGKTITVRLGTTNTGAVVGTATVDTLSGWTMRIKPGIVPPATTTSITAWSSGGGKQPVAFIRK